MFDGTETAARRICTLKPYNSDFRNAPEARYTASTTSTPRCQTTRSRKCATGPADGNSTPAPSPQSPAPGSLARMLAHIHQNPEHRQRAQQRASAVADHGQRDAFRRHHPEDHAHVDEAL